jgi:hypothetical protein
MGWKVIVVVPYDSVMQPVECREAPLGQYDELDSRIVNWFNQYPDVEWDYDYLGVDYIQFLIESDTIGLLFKLTWGGDV